MKGKMKKLVALALAAIMVLAMGITASAADITIKGAVKGATYTAYRIFNVTTNDDGGVSYTRPSTQKLPEGFTDLFTEVDNGGSDVYYIQKNTFTESGFIEYLKTNEDVESFALESKRETLAPDAENAELTISGLSDGYYYVKSSANNGAAAMLRAVDGNINITEKNTEPGWGDNGGKTSYEVTDDGRVEEHFFAVGETVQYEVTYENAQNFVTKTVAGETTTTKVYQYVATDTMPDGMELDTESIVVKVDEDELVLGTKERAFGTYVIDALSTNGFTIKIPWAATDEVTDAATAEDFYYDVPATITITYNAKVTAEVKSGEAIINKATVDYNDTKIDTGKENKIYTGSLQVLKFDLANVADKDHPTEGEITNADKLSGAEFVIVKDATVTPTTMYLTYTEADGYAWKAKKADGSFPDNFVKLTTGSNGLSEIVEGLDQGTYYLLETKAPDGYNLLEHPVEVEIAVDNTEDDVQETDLVKISSIGNNMGSLLPSTGGIGTTIFYVVGGLLVAGAGILLITKKRMRKEQ